MIAYGAPLSNHGLNAGCAGDWRVLPRWNAGSRLLSLRSGGRSGGALTNLDQAVAWSKLRSPGGYGSVVTDGVDGYVDMGVIPGLAGTGNATIAGWLYRAAATTNTGFGCYLYNQRFEVQWWGDGNVYTAAEGGVANFQQVSGGFAGTGWKHFIFTFDGSQSSASSGIARVAIYVDGIVKTLITGSGTVPATLSGSAFRVGMDTTPDDRFYPTQGDAFRIYPNRTLSATESGKLYQAERLRVNNPLIRSAPAAPLGLAEAVAALRRLLLLGAG